MTNPFLSMWLSALNSAAGASRGFWAAEVQRQQTAFLQQLTRQAVDFWTGAWLARLGQPASTTKAGERPAKRR